MPLHAQLATAQPWGHCMHPALHACSCSNKPHCHATFWLLLFRSGLCYVRSTVLESEAAECHPTLTLPRCCDVTSAWRSAGATHNVLQCVATCYNVPNCVCTCWILLFYVVCVTCCGVAVPEMLLRSGLPPRIAVDAWRGANGAGEGAPGVPLPGQRSLGSLTY